MTVRTITAGSFTLIYDAENRAASITGSGLEARYVYDGNGKRLLAVVNGVRTVYIGDYFEAELGVGTEFPVTVPPLINYDPCHDDRCSKFWLPHLLGPDEPQEPLIGMTEGNFGTTHYHTHPVTPGQVSITWRVYYSVGGERIGMQAISNSADDLYYLLTEALGSTNKVLDAEGNLVSELRYNAWGETRYSNGITPTDRKYTGQLEAEAGLYFYGARWYDPALGRWIQPDSDVPNPNKSTDWDRFSYVRNNPINYIDPDGNDPKWISGWDEDYLIQQTGNTCVVVATAVSLSILTGHKYTQADIQPVFFHTYDNYKKVPIDTNGRIIWSLNFNNWKNQNLAIGVIPIEQALVINTMFPGQVKATFSRGTRADLIANLYNGCPTIVTIALPGLDVAHALVVIGYEPETNELQFFNPATGLVQSESQIKLRYGKSFDDLWAGSNILIPSNSMVTLSMNPPIGIPSIGDLRVLLGGSGGGGMIHVCMT